MESDEQPFGIHGIHGRTLPIALGVKSGSPDSNVIIVAGDGDFLSIGMEHIGPQAQRNLNVTAIIMDNGVYGLNHRVLQGPVRGSGNLAHDRGGPDPLLCHLQRQLGRRPGRPLRGSGHRV